MAQITSDEAVSKATLSLRSRLGSDRPRPWIILLLHHDHQQINMNTAFPNATTWKSSSDAWFCLLATGLLFRLPPPHLKTPVVTDRNSNSAFWWTWKLSWTVKSIEKAEFERWYENYRRLWEKDLVNGIWHILINLWISGGARCWQTN